MESTNDSCNILLLDNNFQRQDKSTRIKTLQKIWTELSSNTQIITPSIFDQVSMQILNCFSDPSEKCREISINIIAYFLKTLDKNDYYLTYIFPTLTARLGDIVIIEESEEIRLELVKLTHEIIQLYSGKILPFFDSCTKILTKTVLDPYNKIKQESCLCISALTKALPKHFHMQSESYLTATAQILKNQQYRIRIAGIKCVTDIIEYSSNKINDEVFVVLSCCMNDMVPSVRLAVIRAAHAWLLRYPDRYSYFVKILPLILLGLTDEVVENRNEAEKLWNEVGKQYAKENEKDLKDKLDFLSEKNLGCRILVIRNTMHLLGGICNDLKDWKVEIRVMSARLLYMVVVHNEGDITQHLQTLIPALGRSIQDNEVQEYIENSARVVGKYILANVYCGIILPAIINQTESTYGQLAILALLMNPSNLESLNEKLPEIMDVLLMNDICQKSGNIIPILNCCEQIIKLCTCSMVEYQLFVILITISSFKEEKASQLLLELSKLLNYATVDEFYITNSQKLFETIEWNAATWTTVTPEFRIFNVLLNSVPNLCKHFEKILSILKKCLLTNPDVDTRLSMFLSFSMILNSMDENSNIPTKSLIMDIMVPNLEWHAGRLKEALRNAVVTCLCVCLSLNTEGIPFTLIDQLVGLLDERISTIRLNVLKAIGCIAKCYKNQIASDVIHRIYTEIMKRLDDTVDSVRIEAIITLKFLWEALDIEAYTKETSHSTHLEYLYSTLLVHINDPSEDIQNHIVDLLKIVARLNEKMLKDKIDRNRDKFRNERMFEVLLSMLTINE